MDTLVILLRVGSLESLVNSFNYTRVIDTVVMDFFQGMNYNLFSALFYNYFTVILYNV